MPTFTTLTLGRSALLASAISLAATVAAADAAAAGITLPPDSSTLRSSTLPGYALAQQKCGICHSADYISHQPPGLDQAHWTAEMVKMQHSYGAPLDQDEIALIGAYLAVAYGSANANDTRVTSLTASWEAAQLARDSKPAGGGEIPRRCHRIRIARQLDPPRRRRQMGPGGHAADGSSWRRSNQSVGSICAEAINASSPAPIHCLGPLSPCSAELSLPRESSTGGATRHQRCHSGC